MTIQEIAFRINEIAADEGRPFSTLQGIRNNNGKRPFTWKPFSAKSIQSTYAFHSGGRSEFQFNFGADYIDDEPVFRYGIAFPLTHDRNIHDSLDLFKDQVERFNQYLTAHPAFFQGYEMWYYDDRDVIHYLGNVMPINDTMFQVGYFIFIGKHFDKQVEEITEADIRTVLDTFDELILLYETVQFGDGAPAAINERRIARLCWNDNGWVEPSGRDGKSQYPGSQEEVYGYGHDEWLFDTGKLIDGYHYGLLTPVSNHQDSYAGRNFDVWLYTINGTTRKRYWVGEIKNVEVLDKNAAEAIKNEYIQRGWLGQMEDQIEAAGADRSVIQGWDSFGLFNVRFLPSDIMLNDPYVELPEGHPVIEQSRYNFGVYRTEYSLSEEAGVETSEQQFKFHPPIQNILPADTPTIVEKKTYTREPTIVEIEYLHKAISDNLTETLRKTYGHDNVRPEHPAGYGANRIDMVVNDTDGLIFYEIKTYTSLLTSIRVAIGQLMEYAMWHKHQKAKQWIIVTQPHEGHEDLEAAKVYFKHLRDTFNLPIYYQSFNHENGMLSETF
ncbi:MAG: hypothetical protein R2830_19115 [Saprospiraceae bacterium]